MMGYNTGMMKSHNDHEKTTAQLLREIQELRALVQGSKWAPVPAFPALEISEDCRSARLVKAVQPQKDGTYAVTVNGQSVRKRLEDLHKAAWPHLWPEAARKVEIAVRGTPAPQLEPAPEPEPRPVPAPPKGFKFNPVLLEEQRRRMSKP